MQIDHIGVVVKDTDQTLKPFTELFGFGIEEVQVFPNQGFKSTLVIKDAVRIELIEPMGDSGIIQKFIGKSGYGLHHISLRVGDIEKELGALTDKGARLINDKPVPITDASSISFLHPASTAGILIELIHRKVE
jgi:methylmalonyl-CoA/ethylmalonyl-CoA epimerase